MNLLMVAAYYPHDGYLFSGVFNERSACALREICEVVDVVVPRPYAPPVLSSFLPRWKVYQGMIGHEIRKGLNVYRPNYLQIPKLGGAFWIDPGAYLCCSRAVKKLHAQIGYHAILSFDLVGAGALAWRLGRALGIPAAGWAIGGDIRFPAASPYRRVLLRAINNLDMIFYQSHELLEKAAELLGVTAAQLADGRHLVLPRGTPAPAISRRERIRREIRAELGIGEKEIVVLNIGRMVRDKGIFELLEAISLAAAKNPRIVVVLVGSNAALDETTVVRRKISEASNLRHRVKLLPTCDPDKVAEYFCAADIFAFPSHEEGMPNSLLEAMAAGLPSVAFAIPPVLEIDAGSGGVVTVPLKDAGRLADAILRLSGSAEARERVGRTGRSQVFARFMLRKNMAKAAAVLAELVQKNCVSSAREIPERLTSSARN